MNEVLGHEAQAAAIRDAARTGKLHHAWLLAGPKGVGKASFALAAARWLLAEAAGSAAASEGFEVAEDNPTARLMAAGSHPDFRLLERLPRETTGDLARNISIAQVRSLQTLFATTPSLSPRRVVMIDSIDDLERAAANALLKNLEEPPAGTLFLLVSHAPGRLLPTIRSRCRLLRFAALDDAAMTSVLRRELPEAGTEEVSALARIGGGAPGEALRFAGLDIAGLDASLAKIAETGDPFNAERGALSRSFGAKSAQPRYEALLERAPAFIAATAKRRSGAALAEAIETWEAARDLSSTAIVANLDAQAVAFELGGLVARLAPKSRS